MIKCNLYQNLLSALDRQAAVALIEPRQVGKTTLALEIASTRKAAHLDLEAYEDREKLKDPALFLTKFYPRALPKLSVTTIAKET